MKVACQLMKMTTNVCVIKRGRDRKMFWVMQRSMPNGLVYSTQLTKSFISAGAPLWRHSLWLCVCVCTCISVWFLLCVTLCCNNKCLLDMEEASHPWSTWVSTYTTHYSMSVTWTEVRTHTHTLSFHCFYLKCLAEQSDRKQGGNISLLHMLQG